MFRQPIAFLCIDGTSTAISTEFTGRKTNCQHRSRTSPQLAIAHDGTTVLLPSDIAMQCTESEGKPIAFTFGKDVKVTKATRTSVDTSFPTPFYKKASVKDTYNQLTLKCRNGYSIQFRAYDDGAAYRFVSELRKPFCVKDEIAEFNFDRDYHAFVPYINDNRAGERYCYSFESYYDEAPSLACTKTRLPLLR